MSKLGLSGNKEECNVTLQSENSQIVLTSTQKHTVTWRYAYVCSLEYSISVTPRTPLRSYVAIDNRFPHLYQVLWSNNSRFYKSCCLIYHTQFGRLIAQIKHWPQSFGYHRLVYSYLHSSTSNPKHAHTYILKLNPHRSL